MKTLVVFCSRTGNTRKIGSQVAMALKADVEELVDRNSRDGLIGWIVSTRDALQKSQADLAPLMHDPADYDLVIVGSPVWGGNVATPVRTFLALYRKSLKRVAWFCTCNAEDGSSAEKVFPEMTAESGRTPIATFSLGPKAIKEDHSLALNRFISQLTPGA